MTNYMIWLRLTFVIKMIISFWKKCIKDSVNTYISYASLESEATLLKKGLNYVTWSSLSLLRKPFMTASTLYGVHVTMKTMRIADNVLAAFLSWISWIFSLKFWQLLSLRFWERERLMKVIFKKSVSVRFEPKTQA